MEIIVLHFLNEILKHMIESLSTGLVLFPPSCLINFYEPLNIYLNVYYISTFYFFAFENAQLYNSCAAYTPTKHIAQFCSPSSILYSHKKSQAES